MKIIKMENKLSNLNLIFKIKITSIKRLQRKLQQPHLASQMTTNNKVRINNIHKYYNKPILVIYKIRFI